MNFNYFDIAVIVIISFFALRGILRGFIKEIFSLVGLVGSIWVAYAYYPVVSAYFSFIDSVAWRNVAAYVIIFLICMVLVAVLVSVIQRILSFSFLTWADKLLGFCFGLFKGMVICSIVAILVQGLFGDTNLVQNAFTPPYLNMMMEYVQSHIPSDTFNIFADE